MACSSHQQLDATSWKSRSQRFKQILAAQKPQRTQSGTGTVMTPTAAPRQPGKLSFPLLSLPPFRFQRPSLAAPPEKSPEPRAVA
ncbi:hypothetical protein TREES_T100021816 [Tupaia chinensis]|uniref:Uncharacterized protein n=1 Tax=Tupaia chinensis TaxID=246437 RepID=L9JDM7_TUPCH|nr:hypothetical protein TREES_T100021816 [Tupaia chinensis]